MQMSRIEKVFRSLMTRRSLIRCVVPFLVSAACLCANAANVNGRITGIVTDPQDLVVQKAQIRATNTATGVKYTTVSGKDGGYLFPELPIGSYSISVTVQGFQTFTASGVDLKIDQEYVL